MTITVSSKALEGAVGWAARALSARPYSPALSALRVEVSHGEMTVSGYDGISFAEARCEASGDLPPTFVHGATLARMVDALDGDVTVKDDGSRLVLQVGRTDRVRVGTLPGVDYPTVPRLPEMLGVATGLKAAIAVVAAAAADPQTLAANDSKIGYTCVRMMTHPEESGVLHVYASDTYRVHHAVTAWEGTQVDVSIGAKALVSMIGPLGDGPVSMGYDDDTYALQQGPRVITTTRPAEQLNDAVRGLLSRYAWIHGSVTVPRKVLVDKVSKAQRLLGGGATTIKMGFTSDSLAVAAVDDVNDYATQIPATASTIDSTPAAIPYQPTFVLEALAALRGTYVRIHLNSDPRLPVWLLGIEDPDEESGDSGDDEALLMPVRVTGSATG